MNKKVKKAIYFLLSVLITSALMSAAAFFVFNTDKTEIDNNIQSVPYYEETPPDNVGLLFRFDAQSSVFLNLDFYGDKMSVILFDSKITQQAVLDYGYTVDYVFDTDYIFLADFIDRFSGVEIQTENDLRRCTGIQVTEMLEAGKISRRDVITALFSKISFTGFSKNDLTFIIKNTGTSLNFPSGYPIIAHIPRLCGRVNFVN